jgi:hypothetical protein
MHMAPRAAAWVAWAAWTCNIRHCRRNLQVPLLSKGAGFGPLPFFGRASPPTQRAAATTRSISPKRKILQYQVIV